MGKEIIAMLLAGGQGSRLYALTSKLAKPAVPLMNILEMASRGIWTVSMAVFMYFRRISRHLALTGTKVQRTLFTRTSLSSKDMIRNT